MAERRLGHHVVFLKALATEQESGKPACETGGDVSDEPVRRD